MTSFRSLQRCGFGLALFCATAGCRAGHFSEAKNATIGAAGVRLIKIVSEGGVLKIDGRAGDSIATIRALVLGSSRRIVSRTRLVATRSGDVITIRPLFPRRGWFHWGNSFLAAMDMSITVPAGVAIEVSDGSGDIVARGVGPIKITDGSGGIGITAATGLVEINDGSGDININGVEGDVKITDGSGTVAVENVTGDLNVPSDGSGDLIAQRIGGNVRVNDTGSGSLNVAHVGSDLIVGEKGKGSIRYEDIRGKVVVPHRR